MKNIKISARLKMAFGIMMLFTAAITIFSVISIRGGSLDPSASIRIVLILAALSALFGTWAMFSFVGSIVKPIRYLAGLAVDVSNGDLNILLHSQDKDEIGALKNSFGKMIQIINNLTDEIEYMAVAQAEGVSSEYIEARNYKGKYNEIALLVNDMQTKNTAITNSAINTVYEIGGGNFDAPVDRFPGDKVVLNETIELLRRNLKNVHKEIGGLAYEDEDGKLANRADMSQFTGDWANLLLSLNTLMETITSPINEAVSVVGQMSEGNLNVSMVGKYKGDYEKIKTSVNFMTTEIGGYIKEISSVLNSLASNDFTVGINREYVGDFSALKDSINNISANLNKVMTEIRSAAEQLNVSSAQISDTSMSVAIGVKDQTDSIEDLNKNVADFMEITRKNSKNASMADKLADDVSKAAALGNEEMGRLLDAMEEIQKSSESITSIIKVIKDIAFQTNLLALNASVEAARAGEYGKGFAVVAEEVRNLANRSQRAAQETEELLLSSFKKVESGSSIAQITSKALKDITGLIMSVSEYIHDISNVSILQVEKVEAVGRNVDVISGVTTTNSATSQQSAATAQELSGQAQLFYGVLADFKLM